MRNLNALRGLGWAPEVVWECETRDPERLRDRLRQILERRVQELLARVDEFGAGLDGFLAIA